MSKDAMKLALEALKSCDAAHITDGGRQWYDEKLVDKAVEALREALAEQPAQTATYTCGVCGVPMQMEKPAQPQQEPVAIALNTGTKQGVKWLKNIEHGEHLYTSPPAQRTWVGLTDIEYDNICGRHSAMTDFDFLQDIEAKLKEKNT